MSARRIATKVVSLALLIALLAPLPAHGGLGSVFSAIFSTITDVIGKTLGEINRVQTDQSNMVQKTLWPLSVISSTRAWSQQLIGQYRGWMFSVYSVPIQSAQLPVTRQLETAFRTGAVGSISNIGPTFVQTYGPEPTPQQAPINVHQMIDVDDALAQDALKQTVASDQATANTLSIADRLENQATVSPGTATYIAAAAYATTLQTLAFQHKMLASQLREEAAALAHQSAMLKRSTENTERLYQQIQMVLR